MKIMKTVAIDYFKLLFNDKLVFRLCVVVAVIGLAAAISAIVRLHATDLQIATRYTAFGETQYYRNHWYYLTSVVIFIIMIAISHIVLVAKLLQQEMRNIAILLCYGTLFILLISVIMIHSIFSVAYLS
ncbi:hypothetical protein KC952_04225 [Candidatus Saccharibacteria bacterium]|nr:hypothetical protein [Candidatus Saccharibacteria bacterium]